MELTALEAIAHRAEDLLGLVREGQTSLDKTTVDVLLRGLDAIKVLRDLAVSQRSDGDKPEDLRVNLRANEAQGGPIAGSLGYSPDQPFSAVAVVNGEVIANIPLQKQIFANETGLSAGRFFGNTLVVNAGAGTLRRIDELRQEGGEDQDGLGVAGRHPELLARQAPSAAWVIACHHGLAHRCAPQLPGDVEQVGRAHHLDGQEQVFAGMQHHCQAHRCQGDQAAEGKDTAGAGHTGGAQAVTAGVVQ